MNIDHAELAAHVVGEDHVVVELHERVTAPGTALELHVVQDSFALFGQIRPWPPL